MSEALETLQQLLKQLPGLGYRSAERIAMHLLVEKPERLPALVHALEDAAAKLHRCAITGNLTEADRCAIYADTSRNRRLVCVVEHVPDLLSMERSGAFKGTYHVLHGKLSPLHGVGPEDLHLAPLRQRIIEDEVEEMILALSNDIEGEATCHYIQENIAADVPNPPRITRIGFGLPSGGNLLYADSTTLRSALDNRREFE